MKITVPAQSLRAALECAAKQDIRYYLCGVLVEVRKQRIKLVATDGSMMIVIDAGASALDDEDTEVIVPTETIKAFFSLNKKAETAEFEFKLSDEEFKIGNIGFKPVDGRFPDWRRVMPTGDLTGLASTEDAVVVGAEYLLRIQKLAKIFGTKGVAIVSESTNNRRTYRVLFEKPDLPKIACIVYGRRAGLDNFGPELSREEVV